jgi:hypothetical protein
MGHRSFSEEKPLSFKNSGKKETEKFTAKIISFELFTEEIFQKKQKANLKG